MFLKNYVNSILIENEDSFTNKNKIYCLSEADLSVVNNTMVSNLYRSAIEKSHVDFDSIPDSKGDLTKFSGFKSMMDTIDLLHHLSDKMNSNIGELNIVETAISNIINFRESFEKGFKLEKEFIILQYNVLVFACIKGLSSIISSYIDFVKRPDKTEFMLIQSSHMSGQPCINNLEKFNMCVRNGDFAKVMKTVIESGRNSFVGTETLMIGSLIMGGVLILVPLMRELIFYFYYSRLKLSDYLKTQAIFLEINKNNIMMNSSIPGKDKKTILDRQHKTIILLRNLSDKIRVNDVTALSHSVKDLNSENKGWTLDKISTQSASVDGEGFKLL